MAISADLVPIERPCPVDLDPALSDGSRRAWHCGHCDQKVHVLSSMTEDEAREFMAANDGKKICVTYMERADGSIQFRQPPPPPPPRLVPVSALSSRRIALGLGLSAALAACTPTERTEAEHTVEKTPVQVQVDAKVKSEPEAEPCDGTPKDDTKMSDLVQRYKAEAELARVQPEPEPEVEPEPEPEVVPEVLVPRPGGITARPLPPPTPTAPTVMRRGGIGG